MYIITEKEENRILMFGEALHYLDNDYPCLTNENLAFPTDMVNVYEAEMPSEVEAEKWCYTEEEGFYENENYIEPITDFDRGYEQALLDLMELEETVEEESEVTE